MASRALTSLLAGIEEVRELQQANPTPPGGLPARPRIVRAINRASVVLLSSHLERYLRAVNDEAVVSVNGSTVSGNALPQVLRLQHSRIAVDEMSETQWDNRAGQLADFSTRDSWLWGGGPKGDLAAERLLQWMKSPSPERIVRLFALWGVPDVFDEVTRTQHTRGRLWFKLNELVDKRNNIAHGDASTVATFQDVASYLAVVREFCTRADRVLSRALSRHLGMTRPW